MATPKTLLSVEAVDAMIQKAQNLLAEAQALGQQYVHASQDIAGVGWAAYTIGVLIGYHHHTLKREERLS